MPTETELMTRFQNSYLIGEVSRHLKKVEHLLSDKLEEVHRVQLQFDAFTRNNPDPVYTKENKLIPTEQMKKYIEWLANSLQWLSPNLDLVMLVRNSEDITEVQK